MDTYEKKYKEALGWMRDVYPTLEGAAKEDAEHYFPELKDNDDERIRKELIKQVVYIVPNDDETDNEGNVLPIYQQRIDKYIAWLEKQGAKVSAIEGFESEFERQVSCLIASAINKEHEYNQGYVKWTANALLNYARHELEKQDKQKPVDKTEPKFKVGDWVVSDDKDVHDGYRVCKITKIDDRRYYIEGGGFLSESSLALYEYRLWTIQEAKDGDILVASDGSIFLFAGVVDCACKYYVALTTDNYVKINKEEKDGYWETSRAVYPATEEQRNLLFQKMKEAGYEWDSEKKELRKIEQKPAEWPEYWSEEDENIFENLIELIQQSNEEKGTKKGLAKFRNRLKSLKLQNTLKPSAWSEEDNAMLISIENILIGRGHSFHDKEINWLKSLRPKSQWKPSDKQIMALRWVLNHIPYDSHKEEISGLLEQLKKLREE